ncbi:MAG: tRNA lysidine(34) synthetase TilS [Planctomycetes bacterium]|nr:tRNA lysidine(34) synthetase TilS [Planctomycetota bacterium]
MRSFEKQLADAWPIAGQKDEGVVLAVSGGADSIALARAFLALRGEPAGCLIAHFNHQLRGQESEEDLQFVQEFATRYRFELEVGTPPGVGSNVTVDASRRGQGLENLARQVRYQFLHATARRRGFRYVVTAHTADDQLETVLHRIVRGTGVGGLAGIPGVRRLSEAVSVVRPLLQIRRDTLRDYLRQITQPFREDSSNLDGRFTRNRIRGSLLPLLERDFGTEVGASILRLAALATETQDLVSEHAAQLGRRSVRVGVDGVRIRRDELRNQPPLVVREMLIQLWKSHAWPRQQMNRSAWEQLEQLIRNGEPGSRQIFPGRISLTVDDDLAILSRLRTNRSPSHEDDSRV